MAFLQKRTAGSDSFGNHWPTDGAVVEVPDAQAVVLLAIRDSGFVDVGAPAVVVDTEPPSQEQGETPPGTEPDGPDPLLDPPAPEPEPEPEPKKAAPARSGGRRTGRA